MKKKNKANNQQNKTVDKIVESIWSKYDQDDNGKLDYEELKKMLKETFEKIKQDGDGEDREKIKTPSDAQMEKAFKEYDTDGNGWVDKAEMRKYVRKQMGMDDEEPA